MMFKTDLSTDVARLGIWDAAAGDPALGVADLEDCKEDLAAGMLFIVDTSGDCSMSAEFYIDEPVPIEKLRIVRTVNREFLLRCASGELVADGLEEYRALKPQITNGSNRHAIPPGDYRLRVHIGENEDQRSEEDLIKGIGAEDYAYYKQISSRQTFGCLGAFLALFPALLLGWSIPACLGLGALLALAGYFSMGLLLSQNARYQRISEKLNAYCESFPALIFELSGIDESTAATLIGGRVHF